MRSEHPVFNTPVRIDTTQTIEQPTPGAWKNDVASASVAVLPLVEEGAGAGYPGWVVYENTLQSPDIEFICGGINSKTTKAAGVWRQGNLMHFGFEETPAQLNDTGDGLLINAIVYIAQFTEDRPIVHAPSPFAGERVQKPAGELYDRAQVDLSSDEFLARAVDLLADPALSAEVGRMLAERVHGSGPGANATAEAWNAWLEENRDYLFFSQHGGWKWYIDGLAKKRGVPTKDLRGLARADKE